MCYFVNLTLSNITSFLVFAQVGFGKDKIHLFLMVCILAVRSDVLVQILLCGTIYLPDHVHDVITLMFVMGFLRFVCQIAALNVLADFAFERL